MKNRFMGLVLSFSIEKTVMVTHIFKFLEWCHPAFVLWETDALLL
jgi:hypothetical protein